MRKKFIINFIISLVSIIIVSGLGTLFVNMGDNWYNGLTKPTQWPPNYVIPIVWTVIYIATAIILFFWLEKEESLQLKTLILFIINGILNILWCLTFFTLKRTFLGIVVIVINAFFAYLLLIDIKEQKPVFSKILLIYPIWLSIAMLLNAAIWILN